MDVSLTHGCNNAQEGVIIGVRTAVPPTTDLTSWQVAVNRKALRKALTVGCMLWPFEARMTLKRFWKAKDEIR